MLGLGGLKRGGSAQQRHRRQDRPHFDQGFQFSQVVFGGGGGVGSRSWTLDEGTGYQKPFGRFCERLFDVAAGDVRRGRDQ